MDLLLEWMPEVAFPEDDEMHFGHVPHGERKGVEQIPLTLVIDKGSDVHDDRDAVRQPEFTMQICRRDAADAFDIDAVVHHADAVARDAVLIEHLADGVRGGNEAGDLPMLPSREGIAAEMKVDAARGHKAGRGHRRPERQRSGGDGDGMRVMGMHDGRPVLGEQPRQAPRRGDINFRRDGEPQTVRRIRRAPVEFAVGMRDQQRPMPARTQALDGQEGLLLSAAPGAGGVDVEADHSSHSLAYLRPT